MEIGIWNILDLLTVARIDARRDVDDGPILSYFSICRWSRIPPASRLDHEHAVVEPDWGRRVLEVIPTKPSSPSAHIS